MSDSIEPEWSNSFQTNHAMSCKSECLSAESPTATFRNSDFKLDPPNRNYVDQAQSIATERLVNLKRKLREVDGEGFWSCLMETIASICGAQYAFVARRVPDSEPVGRLGGKRPSLFGFAFYYNDGYQTSGMHRNRYFAGVNPLCHMDHEKPCLIPENLASLMSFGLDRLPFAAEGYLTVPLFSGRTCLAHLGLMWSESGLRKRCLPWSYLEMILYSVEELIVQHIRDDAAGQKSEQRPQRDTHTTTIPVTQQSMPDFHSTLLHGSTEFSSQPLKPYARSLSHELRTPMQGVVGMLDVMHATVREALEGKPSTKTVSVLHSLKEGIEMVQDSARRAVEAADNVVHAYDLNMQVPQTPQIEREEEILGGPSQSPVLHPYDGRPNIFIEGSNITVNPYKRRRSNPPEYHGVQQPKQKIVRTSSRKGMSPRSEEVKNAVHESDKIVHATPARQIEAVVANIVEPRPSLAVRRSAPHLLLEGINVNLKNSAVRYTKLRDLLRLVINESLHVGGRPEFAVSDTTELGERIEVRSRSSNGDVVSKVIEWSVEAVLPDTLLVDDRDLAKLISCVFLNAVKFTNSGAIDVSATISHKSNDVLITVRDTGRGIPEAFLPKLFKPFAQEDASITRSKDGLGLGLLVAKGLARKMGGDLICVRSCTSGPTHGSVFEIRVPINQPRAGKGPTNPAEKLMTPPQLDPSRLSIGSTSGSPSSSILSPSTRLPSQPIQQPSPCLTDEPSSSSQTPTPVRPLPSAKPRRTSITGGAYDSSLGQKYPLTFLVAEDNKINRRVLVNMLRKLGYHEVYEACNGKEAVRITQDALTLHRASLMPAAPCTTPDSPGEFPIPNQRNLQKENPKPIDIILMDLWMPEMDGYEATSRILQLIDQYHGQIPHDPPTTTRCPSNTAPNSAHSNAKPGPHFPPSPTVLAVSADVTDEALGRASKVGMKGYMTKPYKLSDLERLIVEFRTDA